MKEIKPPVLSNSIPPKLFVHETIVPFFPALQFDTRTFHTNNTHYHSRIIKSADNILIQVGSTVPQDAVVPTYVVTKYKAAPAAGGQPKVMETGTNKNGLDYVLYEQSVVFPFTKEGMEVRVQVLFLPGPHPAVKAALKEVAESMRINNGVTEEMAKVTVDWTLKNPGALTPITTTTLPDSKKK